MLANEPNKKFVPYDESSHESAPISKADTFHPIFSWIYVKQPSDQRDFTE